MFVVLSGKSDGDRTGIGRAEHLEKAHFVKKRVVFFTKFESDGERTGTDGERTGNGRGTDGERKGRNLLNKALVLLLFLNVKASEITHNRTGIGRGSDGERTGN